MRGEAEVQLRFWTAHRERFDRRVFRSIHEQDSRVSADQIRVFEAQLVGTAQACARPRTELLESVDEGPAQSVVLTPSVADAVDQRRGVVEQPKSDTVG